MKLFAETSISSSQLSAMSVHLIKRAEAAREPVHHAMATQFRQCTYDNLGATGFYRPHVWALLSPRYAKKVNRTYATLNVSGLLRSSIKVNANVDRGRVSISKADCEYALAHQYGVEENNLPARPYFPIHKDGTVVRAVQDLVKRAAQLALGRALAKR